MLNPEFIKARNEFIEAAMKLSREFENLKDNEPNEAAENYPKCLPSFDEFVIEAVEWMGWDKLASINTR